MSPHERKALATIEKELRADDSELAAVFDRTSSPSSSTSDFPLSARHVLLLLGALTGLIAVYTVLADKPGPPALAAMTAVAVVPWIVAGAWSAKRRSLAPAASDGGSDVHDDNRPGTSGGTGPLRAKRQVLLAVVALLVILALLFPPGSRLSRWHLRSWRPTSCRGSSCAWSSGSSGPAAHLGRGTRVSRIRDKTRTDKHKMEEKW